MLQEALHSMTRDARNFSASFRSAMMQAKAKVLSFFRGPGGQQVSVVGDHGERTRRCICGGPRAMMACCARRQVRPGTFTHSTLQTVVIRPERWVASAQVLGRGLAAQLGSSMQPRRVLNLGSPSMHDFHAEATVQQAVATSRVRFEPKELFFFSALWSTGAIGKLVKILIYAGLNSECLLSCPA